MEGGLPQSRSRVYIVGWKNSEQTCQFAWPSRIQCKTLTSLLEPEVVESDIKANKENTHTSECRVQRHLVAAAQRIQKSMIENSFAKDRCVFFDDCPVRLFT